MRLQILELPRRTADDEIPYALVLSELTDDQVQLAATTPGMLNGLAKVAGARGALAFTSPIELGEASAVREPFTPQEAAQVVVDYLEDAEVPVPQSVANMAANGDPEDDRRPDDPSTQPPEKILLGDQWKAVGTLKPGQLQQMISEPEFAAKVESEALKYLNQPRSISFNLDSDERPASLDELAAFFGVPMPRFEAAEASVVDLGDTLLEKLNEINRGVREAFAKRGDKP